MNRFMRVTRLPNDHAGCGWYELLPAPAPPVLLTGEQHADWVVLGGGLTGLAAARRLATLQPHTRVVLIDAQRIGFGASGRNSGFMIDLPHDLNSDSYTGCQEEDRELIDSNRAAIAYLRGIVREHGIECDWSEQGKIHAAVSDRGAEALVAFQRGLDSLGERYTPLSAADLASVTGTTFYRTGVHTPGTVLVQPAALARGLARTMPENVQIFENSPVTGIDHSSAPKLQCPRGSITAANLLLTNNGFASTFGFLKRRLIPIFTYGSMTRSLNDDEQALLGGENSWGLIPADPVGTTVRRLRNRRILIRNTFTSNPKFVSTEAARRKIRCRHERSFRERFPMLPKVSFDYTWGGVLSLSRNSSPYFGRLMPRIFAAVCHNGLGVARGTIAGKLLAEYASGSDSEMLRNMLSLSSPAWNPPDPIFEIAIRGSIRWKEWRAGREL